MTWQGEEMLVDYMEGESDAHEKRVIETEITLSTRLRKSLKDLEQTRWWLRQAFEVNDSKIDLTQLHNKIMSKIDLK